MQTKVIDNYIVVFEDESPAGPDVKRSLEDSIRRAKIVRSVIQPAKADVFVLPRYYGNPPKVDYYALSVRYINNK